MSKPKVQKVERPEEYKGGSTADRGEVVRKRSKYAKAAEQGVEIDDTHVYSKGTRAGCRSGKAVEEVDPGVFEVVKYGPKNTDPVPCGTERRVKYRVEHE